MNDTDIRAATSGAHQIQIRMLITYFCEVVVITERCLSSASRVAGERRRKDGGDSG